MHRRVSQQLNTQGKRKLWFWGNLLSEETGDDRVWASFPEANGSSVIYFKGCRTKLVGHELEFGPYADPLVSKPYMMTDGEFLSWRDSTELFSVLSWHPFVCLFALSLSSCHSLPVVGVHAFLPRPVLTPAYPQVQGCRESMQSSVGWVIQSWHGKLCWQPPQGLLLQVCATASLALLYKNFLLFSFGTVLSNRAMKMPADGIL